MHQHELIGALVVRRKRVGAFAEDTVSLLQSFAAQSAVAIQNARLFREIEEKSRELEAASRHKSEFLANMSHELRTPLNAVLGYAELIQDGIYGEVPAKMQDVLERIQQNGRHLLGLINDVLDLSKIEAGQLTLSPVDYSMRELVLDVVSATEALAAEKKLALEVDVPADLPPGRGDERRLTQVLMNLVSNAIKFTEDGLDEHPREGRGRQLPGRGVRHRRRHRGGGPRAHFRGVPAGRQLEHAQEGRHGPGPRDRPAHRRAARRPHLGRIDPRPGLDLRLHPAARGLPSRRRGMTQRILVVEDQEDNRRIIRDLLTTAGYELIEATDGEAGVRLAEAERPDLILMDIQLPVLDGHEATRRIRQNAELAAIPIIVVTSYALSGDDAKAMAAGADGYVAKPFSPRHLLATIRQFLG